MTWQELIEMKHRHNYKIDFSFNINNKNYRSRTCEDLLYVERVDIPPQERQAVYIDLEQDIYDFDKAPKGILDQKKEMTQDIKEFLAIETNLTNFFIEDK